MRSVVTDPGGNIVRNVVTSDAATALLQSAGNVSLGVYQLPGNLTFADDTRLKVNLGNLTLTPITPGDTPPGVWLAVIPFP